MRHPSPRMVSNQPSPKDRSFARLMTEPKSHLSADALEIPNQISFGTYISKFKKKTNERSAVLINRKIGIMARERSRLAEDMPYRWMSIKNYTI